ncbi:MAG TPA: hypothetical protein VIJ07_25925 [Dermatophilaceae bacterium]
MPECESLQQFPSGLSALQHLIDRQVDFVVHEANLLCASKGL